MQVCFIWADQEKVIHVSAVVTNVQPLLYKVVKFVQIKQGKKLRGLIAQRQAV